MRTLECIKKRPKIAAMAALIVFLMTACNNDRDNGCGGIDENRTHYAGSLEFRGQQVWAHNENAVKISDAFYEFMETREIIVITYIQDEFSPNGFSEVQVGSGKIENGILSFRVDEPEPEKLLEWDDLKRLFLYWNDVAIDVPQAMGNFITLVTDRGERINRERLVSSGYSLAQESIIFFYINADSVITGNYGEGGDGYSLYYTADALKLSLKKGWNTICRKEAYAQTGRSAISKEIKHPDAKWVIYR